MATKAKSTQRPAEQLKTGIDRVMLHGKRGPAGAASRSTRIVSIRTLSKWWELADEIDARMRLDHSPRSRHKSTGKRSR